MKNLIIFLFALMVVPFARADALDKEALQFQRTSTGAEIIRAFRQASIKSEGAGISFVIPTQGRFLYQWPLADNHVTHPWHEVASREREHEQLYVLGDGYVVIFLKVDAKKWLDDSGSGITSMKDTLDAVKESAPKGAKVCSVISLDDRSLPFFDEKTFAIVEEKSEGRILFASHHKDE